MSTAIASPPVVAVTLSIASPSRSTATTVAPRSASISALARPIPLPAPVTTMTAPEMFAVVIVVPLSVSSRNDGRRRPGVALPDRNRLLEWGATSAVARYCNSPGFGAALPNRGPGAGLIPRPRRKGLRSTAIRQMGGAEAMAAAVRPHGQAAVQVWRIGSTTPKKDRDCSRGLLSSFHGTRARIAIAELEPSRSQSSRIPLGGRPMASPALFDEFDPTELQDGVLTPVGNVHERLRELRERHPVMLGNAFTEATTETIGDQMVTVLGYDECHRVLTDPDTYSSSVYVQIMGPIMGRT